MAKGNFDAKKLQLKAKLFFRQLLIISWKNLYIRRNQLCPTISEILLPVIPIAFAMIMALIFGGGGGGGGFNLEELLRQVPIEKDTSYPVLSDSDLQFLQKVPGSQATQRKWCPSKLAYAPDNAKTSDIMQQLANEICSGSAGVTLIKAASVEELEYYFLQKWHQDIAFRGAIVFTDDLKELAQKGSTQGVISYTIRMPPGDAEEYSRFDSYDDFPNTKRVIPMPGDPEYTRIGPRIFPDKESIQKKERYLSSGFLYLQLSLEKVLVQTLTQKPFSHQVSIQPLPYPAVPKRASGTGTLSGKGPVYLFPLYFFYCCGICCMVGSITYNLVSEKESGISELLRMTGVSSLVQWLGWFIHVSMGQIITVTILTLLLFGPDCFFYTDGFFFWCFMMLYVFATTAMTFLVCAFCRKPMIALCIAIVIVFLTMMAGYVLSSPSIYSACTVGVKVGLSIFPNVALALYYYHVKWMEEHASDDSDALQGAGWSTLGTPLYPDGAATENAISLVPIFLMLLADTVGYMLLTLYFDFILPSEYGITRPWYLFDLDWLRGRGKRQSRVTDAPVDAEGLRAGVPVNQPGIEAEPVDLPVGIEIRNMVKRFGLRKVAVNGMNLRMHVGHIFALLGHNGAGKTTLISMLTGFFEPTSGTAIVGGYDIARDLDKARQNLGVCPQQNMLFNRLTVFQQMRLFGMLRGLSMKQSGTEADMLMMQMHFFDAARTSARKLSGGQKRKLSLGNALIGGTKVIILDEPTSGMDPQARREIWDILLELRKERTVLLTTHYMEEADVLGDRIGVMVNGRLQCCGSSDFLKNFYETGYTLNLTFEQEENQDPDENSAKNVAISSNPSADAVLTTVRKYVPKAAFKKDGLNRKYNPFHETNINLPGDTTNTAVLSQLFADLAPRKKTLGISTIGLSKATMDDVFVRVGEIAEEEEFGANKLDEEEILAVERAPKQYKCRFMGQLATLLIKKCIYSTRKWKLLLFQLLFPLGLFALSIYVGTLLAQFFIKNAKMESTQSTVLKSWTPVEINLKDYQSPVILYSDDSTAPPSLSQYFARLPGSKPVPNITAEILKVGHRDVLSYKRRHILAQELTGTSINIMYNHYPFHAAPLAINVATNAILKSLEPTENYQLRVTSHPFDRIKDPDRDDSQSSTQYRKIGKESSGSNDILEQLLVALSLSVLICLAFFFLSANFLVNPLEERICKCKQLQTMTGVNPLVYWGSSFLWDILTYFVVVCFMVWYLINFDYGFGLELLSPGYGIPVFIFIAMSYGFTAIFFGYLVSFRMASVAGGYVLVILLNIFLGLQFGLIPYDLPSLFTTLGVPGLAGFFHFIQAVLRLCPSFSFVRAITRFALVAQENNLCAIKASASDEDVECPEPDPFLVWETQTLLNDRVLFTQPGVGQEIFYIWLIGLVYFTWVMCLDFKIIRWIGSRFFKDDGHAFVPNIKDKDVAAEADRVTALVASKQVNTECMVAKNLSKSYGTFAAVNRLNFGVHYGECFGLLGINGAGKTTAFRMITGDEMPAYGNAWGFGTSLDDNAAKFYSNIGYCPQFDGFLPLFTGLQMLKLFAGLRGIPYELRGREAIIWLARVGLTESAHVPCGKYSGGMKRRLSTAMAMIGDPQLILLDEPTSGVDPVSRRQFWKILEKLREGGQSFILTSHTMDECEALCTRLGIMVNGQFECFGGVQHLKNKFAQGFTLVLKLKADLPYGTPDMDQKLAELNGHVLGTFSPCEIKDYHHTQAEYSLKNHLLTWDVVFKTMEEVKAQFANLIEDYFVKETSLEEVFLTFAKVQHPDRKANVTLCRQICCCSC